MVWKQPIVSLDPLDLVEFNVVCIPDTLDPVTTGEVVWLGEPVGTFAMAALETTKFAPDVSFYARINTVIVSDMVFPVPTYTVVVSSHPRTTLVIMQNMLGHGRTIFVVRLDNIGTMFT